MAEKYEHLLTSDGDIRPVTMGAYYLNNVNLPPGNKFHYELTPTDLGPF